MSARWAAFLAAVLSVLGITTAAGRAQAMESTLYLDLVLPDEVAPRFLCVAYQAQGNPAAFTDVMIAGRGTSVLQQQGRSRPGSMAWNSVCLPATEETAAACDCNPTACSDGRAPDHARCTIRHQVCEERFGSSYTADQPELEADSCSFAASLKILTRTPRMARGDERQAYHLRCFANEQPTPASTVLVVEAVSEGSAISAVRARFSGSRAVLSFDSVRPSRVAMVQAVGGDFHTGTAPVLDERARLALRPRCVRRSLPLPVVSAPDPEEVAVWELSAAGRTSTYTSGGDCDLRLPEGEQVVVKRFDSATPPKVLHQFSTTWPAPDVAIAPLAASVVSFDWTASPCLRRVIEPADCPTVRLREGGRCTEPAVVPFVSDPALQEENEVAQEPANGTCRYTCRRSNRDRFTLPFDVEFAIAEVEDRWSDRVSVPGEVLRDYASRSDRRFPVTFDQWPAFYKAEREGGYGIHGDLVHHIELVAPDGRVAYVYPKEGQYAEVAGITCGNAIGYRIVGDRSYREGSTTLDGGQFAIPSPAETSEIFQFGVVLGGGFFFLPDGDASQRPFGAATAVFRWEPRNLTEDWHLRWPIAVGVDVTYMISSQEFDSIGSFGSAANEADTVERRFRAYNRAFIRAGFDGPIVLRQFRIGQAVGLGGGWPTLQSAVSAVGGFDFQVLLTPLQAWYVVSNHLHIGTEFHILLSQRVHRYSICEDAACVTSGHGTPHRASAERWRPGWEVLTLRGLY